MDFNEFKKNFEKVRVEENANHVSSQPLVSVCVQTYQHVNFIKQSLDGILSQQTDFDFEILLGEDASSDGTREICMEYANKYPSKIRLYLHNRENNITIAGGPSGRFNLLYNLYAAKGKYIAFCEGDDYWKDPQKLQKQVDFLEANKLYAACFHRAIRLEGSTESVILKDWQENQEVTDEVIISGVGGIFPTASLVFRSEVVNSFVNTRVNSFSGDWKLSLYILLIGKFYFLSDIMSVYRVHEGGILSNLVRYEKDVKRHIEICLVNIEMLKEFNELSKGKYNELIKKEIDKLYIKTLKQRRINIIRDREILMRIPFRDAFYLIRRSLLGKSGFSV
tara:strand:- start:1945 stop:2952 length:1008 start_codon:yes stop_codon:yes gene_type:complete